MTKIKSGDVVRMTKEFRATLDRAEARREARRRYVVKAIRNFGDGTMLVDFQITSRQTCTGATLASVERA